MAWLAVDRDGSEYIYDVCPIKDGEYWGFTGEMVFLPKGTIKKLLGIELTWKDEPAELKEVEHDKKS